MSKEATALVDQVVAAFLDAAPWEDPDFQDAIERDNRRMLRAATLAATKGGEGMNNIDMKKLGNDLRKMLAAHPVTDINVVVVDNEAVYASANHSTLGPHLQLGVHIKLVRP